MSIYNHYEYKIKNFPDDLSVYQYNKRGSLILKIYNSIEIANSIFKKQKKLNKDIILSGILLKYIGRVKQYKYNIIFEFTETGQTEDCFILSRDIVKNFSNNKKIDQKLINDLVDVILYKNDPVQLSDQNFNAKIVHFIFEIENSLSFINQIEQ